MSTRYSDQCYPLFGPVRKNWLFFDQSLPAIRTSQADFPILITRYSGTFLYLCQGHGSLPMVRTGTRHGRRNENG